MRQTGSSPMKSREDEGLGEAVGDLLDLVGEAEADAGAVAEEGAEEGGGLGGGDDEDVADAREHEGGEGVVDHRLVVDRQELLADDGGGGVEPGAGAAGEDDAFTHGWSPEGRPGQG